MADPTISWISFSRRISARSDANPANVVGVTDRGDLEVVVVAVVESNIKYTNHRIVTLFNVDLRD